MSPTTPSVRIAGRLVRVLAPKWATMPGSGAGAARRGGRFNRQGQLALYLSYDLEVAANEYGQDMPTRPGTFCHYDVSLWSVADLTSPSTLAALAITQNDLMASWKDQLSRKIQPSTWAIADRLVAMGYVAARYESVVPQNRPPHRPTVGLNVVVWNWTSADADRRAEALDPTGDLPRDQSSWSQS